MNISYECSSYLHNKRPPSVMESFIYVLLLLFSSSPFAFSTFLNDSKTIRATAEFIKSNQDATYTNIVIIR